MKIVDITEGKFAQIKDVKDFDHDNIEVYVKGWGVLTLSQLREKIKRQLAELAVKVDSSPKAVQHAINDGVITYMINGYMDALNELETPQMKRKATIAKKKISKESIEAVVEHIRQGVPFCDSVFRYQSEAYFDTFAVAKKLHEADLLPNIDWESVEMFGTDIGESVALKGVGSVWLDVPYLYESAEKVSNCCGAPIMGEPDGNHGRCSDCKEMANIINDEDFYEAEYQGKKVELNKPKRGGSKKFYVYTKNPKTGKVKKVSFGAASGGGSLAVKLKDPKARKAFADRHNCDQKNDKTKAGYWSCRLPRYAKSLGLSGGGTWW